ncbi:MAG: hypothetical protein ABJL44_01055 [Algibacter sp.]
MKRIFILLILSLTIQYSFGQACGIYRIKYTGNLKSESLKIEKIKLPTIELLHGLENENPEISFVEIEPTINEINIELRSPLTSHLYGETEKLLKFYKTKRENIPIIITVIQNGKSKEIRMELTWNNIRIKKLEDEKFGNIFELNLSEINVK